MCLFWWRIQHALKMALKSFASSVPEKPSGMRENVMSMVRYKRNELPPLSEKQKAELRKLSDKPDSDIDYSDIAPLDTAFWKNATQGQFYRPVKTQTSVRIDADVLAWLKETGKGYQTRLNAILREAMLRDLHRK
ncbi:conserved protein of unknown function (plasmid) [Xenorhabdus doucetiae]|uniref:Toxin-antitoxin system, antitoxin component n=2 Tax=Xenorhabdus doucetiae TaxID=351671 RepID=A0A068QPH0_9GAMM|nr:conserved protein of unknown function [Xenorhabdus doucetiae]